ncbi:MAG: hypothetical protein Athens071426_36 [Parcubacteria group bacterium Athens0714_26]|nr:MAG: hypothetical protein Athens101426_206 [Parcubacteria group bacterium Athens1014_26]TSD03829.1 MAG: hypothetical protein Athens071426_36 [Parcubacteria group bacterium Athens0714_26]
MKLDDQTLSDSIRKQITPHESVIKSLKVHRDNAETHNDANFTPTHIEMGVENLFQWLEDIIELIRMSKPYLNGCGIINITYNEKLAQCGVDEIFEDLLLSEKNGH